MWANGKAAGAGAGAAASVRILERLQRRAWRSQTEAKAWSPRGGASSSGPPWSPRGGASSSGPPWSPRGGSSSGPPWRLLFFGSDQFAVESLKRLRSSSRSGEGIVESVEVVTLPSDVPVRRFAHHHHLPVHSWPPPSVDGRFDVGVVVSFGCLLPETLISRFPYGVLNVHPSLLPRWRGPAPIFHTIMHGDSVTGVTVIQIRPHRFDVGPILNQDLHLVPEKCTADELGAALATKGAGLLMDTLRTLPEKLARKTEQRQTGGTFAPKVSTSMSWVLWEEQTCDHIDRLYRSIGSRIPLRTTWMGTTVRLLELVGRGHVSLSDEEKRPAPGSVRYQKDSNTLAVCCKDGWVSFQAVCLKKRLTAADFYNGYLHKSSGGHFVSRK
ncbi:methionyl-tRNA formyltransferase, mitochondrial-like [Brachionichthys hirsutus]|uniref:methionyl-tRNA formyltransferase, mitochondrial-like n=1 Tax=Brachionichthys hirsutus TaxID=412623 RepID=UPI0036045612